MARPEIGQMFDYTDADHEGSYDDLSGVYEVTDTSEYPRRVGVRLISWRQKPHDGTTGILGWDAQVDAGLITLM